jgi:hypothetical protein
LRTSNEGVKRECEEVGNFDEGEKGEYEEDDIGEGMHWSSSNLFVC